MLGEAETHELEAERPDGPPRSRTAVLHAHPTAATFVALVGLAIASTVLRAILVGYVHGPKVFLDELGYKQMAQSFAHTGHFSLFGKTGLAYSPLYPIVLSPIYALTSSLHTAYEWAKLENALLISLSVFPIYAVARFVLRRERALAAAALSLLAPLMLYSGFEMSESLAYPLCLVAIWTMLRAVRRPGVANDAILLGAIALASAARLELVVLFPASLTAVLFVAVLGQERAEGRALAARRAIRAHWLLFGAAGAALVAVLARRASNGGDLPLAGRYANLGTTHVDPLRILELFVQHLAELDFAVGVVPFAAALLAGYALVRFGPSRKPLIFASVALATTFWILLEVAFAAAEFDATSLQPRPGAGPTDLPRIHERYLIYLIPLFVVALFATLPLLRARVRMRYHLAITVAVAALPAAIPFGTVINNTNGVDSFALEIFARQLPEKVVPASHATLLILLLSSFAAFIYLCAAAQPFPQLAVAMTAVAFLGVSAVVLGRQTQRISAAALGLPAHANWVDRAVGNRSDVALVAGAGVRPLALKETAFANRSIARVYRTCEPVLGADFGERQLTLDPSGVLRLPSGPIRTRYAVVPAAFHAPGRVLGRDPAGNLVLLAVMGETLWLPPDRRSLLGCAG